MKNSLIALITSIVTLGIIVLYVGIAHPERFRKPHTGDPSQYDPGRVGQQGVLDQREKEQAGTAAQGVGTQPTADLPSQQDLKPSEVTTVLRLGTVENTPAYDKAEFTLRANEVVSLTFSNQSAPDLNYQFGWILVKPGTQGRVQTQADAAGLASNFVPDSPDVIARIAPIPSGESRTIIFRAPTEPGDYPYFSPYPGQGAAMNGILHVVEP